MLKSVALCALFLAASASAEPELAVAGKAIFEPDFKSIGTNWMTRVGTWTVKDGVLTGVERPEQKHGAVCRFPFPFSNALITFEYRFTAGRMASLSVNDAKDHMARLTLTPTSVQARKDDNDHAGPDVAAPFNIVSNIDGKVWQTAEMALVGDWLWTRVGGKLSFGRDPLFAKAKANFGFTVGGEGVEFRNLKVCEATPNAEWEGLAEALRAKYPLPPPSAPAKKKAKKE